MNSDDSTPVWGRLERQLEETRAEHYEGLRQMRERGARIRAGTRELRRAIAKLDSPEPRK